VCRLLRGIRTRVAMGGFLGKLNPAIAGAAPEIRRPCCRLARSDGPRPGDDRGRISVTSVGAFVLTDAPECSLRQDAVPAALAGPAPSASFDRRT